MTQRRALAAVGLLLWLCSPPLGCGGGEDDGYDQIVLSASPNANPNNNGKAGGNAMGGGPKGGNNGKAGGNAMGGGKGNGKAGQAGAGQAGAGQAGAGQAGAGQAGGGQAGAGMGGAGTSGTAGMGGAGTAGTSGMAGNGGSPTNCGNNLRDPFTEECDDGASHLANDACTDTCRVRDMLACPTCGTGVGNERFLGLGRHVVSATSGPGVVVSFPQGTDAAHALIGASAPSVFSPFGADQPGPFLSNPVVVSMPSFFVTVWTGQGTDGDGLGIQARIAHPTSAPLPATVNGGTLFGQRDPDAVRISDTEFVVAWVDDSDLDTGPDLRVATRSVALATGFSGGGGTPLANTADAEGNVALTAFGTTYAAVWRAGMGPLETVRAKTGATSWSVGPFPPGPADDRPSIAQLDATRALVAYSKGIDTDLDGLPDRAEVRVAAFDTAMAGGPVAELSVATLQAPYSDQPVLVVAEGKAYLAYRIPGTPGDPLGDELYFAELAFSSVSFGGAALTIANTWPLPREVAHRAGDQRRPSLSSGPWTSGTALVAAWEDHAKTVTGSLKRDVLMQIIPLPVVRNNPLLAGGN